MINKRKEGYGNHKSKTDASTGSEDARGGAEMTTGKTAAEAFGGSGTTCEYQRRYASNGDVVERWSHSGVNCGACARPLFSACAKDASEEELVHSSCIGKAMGELRCSPETVQLQSLGQPASTISTGSKGTVTIGPPTPSDNNSVQAPQTPPASTTTKRHPSSNVSAIITHYYPTPAQNLTQHFVPIEGSAMRPSNPDDPKITVSPRYCEHFLCQNWIDDYTDISSVNTLRSSVDSELNQWVEVDSSTLMSLDELPENVLIHIMIFCDAVAVCRLGVTCRKLHSLSESPVVWKHLFDQRVTVDPAEYQIESYKLAYKLTEPAVCSSCGARFQPLLVSKEASCYGHKGYATVDVVGATYLKPVWSCCRQLVLVGSKCTVPSKHVVDSWGKWGKRAASVAGAVALSGVVVVANAVATLHP